MSQEPTADRDIKLPDGRILSVEISGASHGAPIFLLHGTPGSRSGPRLRASVLYRLGVCLISYDRPGYGGSTRSEGRSVADAASDVAAIADYLGVERFGVVGRSGGGPHALACAALLGERVTRTAVLVGIAPATANGLDWYDGMNDANVNEYTTADEDLKAFIERLRLRAEFIRSDPNQLVEELLAEMSRADLKVVRDYGIRRLLTDTYKEGLRAGPYGWIDDVFAFRRHWGFEPEQIPGRVRLWHGADDTFSPVAHTQWLARRIPRADMVVQKNSGHFGAIAILPEILAWLAAAPPEERPATTNGAAVTHAAVTHLEAVRHDPARLERLRPEAAAHHEPPTHGPPIPLRIGGSLASRTAAS